MVWFFSTKLDFWFVFREKQKVLVWIEFLFENLLKNRTKPNGVYILLTLHSSLGIFLYYNYFNVIIIMMHVYLFRIKD